MVAELIDGIQDKMDNHYIELKIILEQIIKSIDEIKDEIKEIKKETQSNREKLLSYQTIISFLTKWGATIMMLGGVFYTLKRYFPI